MYTKRYSDGLSASTATSGNAKIKYTYHKHTSSCYSTCGGTLSYIRDTKPQESEYRCNSCGRTYYLGEGYGKWAGTPCQSSSIVCGKTTSTIEKAEIVFN